MGKKPGQQLQVRGSALWGRVSWLREHHGEEGVAQLSEVLSSSGRYVLRSEIDRRGWYNFPLFVEYAVKMDKLFGSGDFTLNTEIGRWACHLATPALYSMFIRIGSVSWVLNRAARLWREHFNAGSLEVRWPEAAKSAELEIVEFPSPHLAHTHAVLGFAVGCVELSGQQEVRGRVVSCRSHGGDRTVLQLEWGKEPTSP